jgi:hypothetical protein
VGYLKEAVAITRYAHSPPEARDMVNDLRRNPKFVDRRRFQALNSNALRAEHALIVPEREIRGFNLF